MATGDCGAPAKMGVWERAESGLQRQNPLGVSSLISQPPETGSPLSSFIYIQKMDEKLRILVSISEAECFLHAASTSPAQWGWKVAAHPRPCLDPPLIM